ncbi:MAG: class I tRNA ligase family protein, partial [Crenarchaeota archaeon]|nr:class I tRNA ligase family protein [Thermoproteota archaeon]
MREEFLYWYPLDLRNSAKELVPNHLSFCIFHHAALFPPQHWPRGIGVNGMLMIEGKQMHKSKGNFITMKGAVDKYGADATRCGLMIGAEGMDDPDWRAEKVIDLQNKLESLLGFTCEIIANVKDLEDTSLEKWLLSRMQQRIYEVTTALEEMKTRTALQTALFDIWNDIRWYIQRKGKSDNIVLKEAVCIWIRLLAPFAPYTCEEVWSKTQADGFISTTKWPQYEESKVSAAANEQENTVIDILSDLTNILKATKITPKRICLFTAANWKWQIYLKVLDKTIAGEAKIPDIMKELAADPEIKPYIKNVAALVPKLVKTLMKYSPERKENMQKIRTYDETQFLSNTKRFFEERFNAQVDVYSEENKERYDPKNRAIIAMPYQPAIYIE